LRGAAIPSLSGGKQTFRELPENDAYDPKATSAIKSAATHNPIIAFA
jgi:hypothetical protein